MKECRICQTNLDKPFLSLGNAPLSNAFLTANDLEKMEPYFPLDVYWCSNCSLVQIGLFEKPENIFNTDYIYYSSNSSSWLNHCQKYVAEMISRYNYNASSLVMEVASNDGYLLQYFKKAGIPVLGVEPSSGCADVAIQQGIQTEVTFFSTEFASILVKKGIQPNLIIGNNVLAHTPYLHDMVEALHISLAVDGLITMEFPHVLHLLDENQFDTIYHEHFSYFSLHAVMRLFRDHDLIIFDVDEIPTHGGSLRIYASHLNSSKRESDSVKRVLETEVKKGLLDRQRYDNFRETVYKTKRDLLNYLITARNDQRRVVGYGAPAKGNTLLNFCGIREDLLEYTVDISPIKQGKFLPGTHIPVFEPEKLKTDLPDEILILPWNIADEVIDQLSYFANNGGKFIIPIPTVRLIE